MMVSARATAACALIAAALVTLSGTQRSLVDRPWPPPVQQVPESAPALPPDEAMKTFYLPPGYRLELVASEPLVQEPVAIDWDPQGRLWVVEMPGYMRDVAASGEHEPIGRVVVLEDADADGKMDRRTVFADRLVLARAIKVLDRGVLVGEPPNAWLMRDMDGDLRMDARELVTDRYGRRDGDPQNNANGFYWALDNRMHTAGQGEVYFGVDNGRIHVEETLPRGEWGVAQDDVGRLYRNTNASVLHVDLVPTPYYARNPNLLRTRGSYERLATEDNDLNTIWPVRPTPGTNRAYQTGINRPDGTLASYTAVCAPLVYRGDRLPAELRGNVFVAEPAANLVGRLIIRDEEDGVRAERAYERGEFIASTDERFRPVFLSDGPDGTLYVVDMYRGILEHRISMTEYLRDYIRSHELESPIGYGRIYRVVHETTARDPLRLAGEAAPGELVRMLEHPNGWWRDTAQRLLVERRIRSVVPALSRLAGHADEERTRLHALWTLDGMDATGAAIIARALQDPSPHVRAAAIRMAEPWLSDASHPLRDAVMKRIEDENWTVRRQLAASAGALRPADRVDAAVALLERYGDDPVTMDAALSSLDDLESVALDRLLGAGDQTPQRLAAITMLSATIARRTQEAEVRTVFARIADASEDDWKGAALLNGIEVALLGAPMPGSPHPPRREGGTAAKLPCATCPGGRAGPGGAYAFPRPASRTAQARRAPALRLESSPDPLLAAAAAGGELSARLDAVLARITWPGKGDTEAASPLTTADRQRFEAGREIYRSICQACHQADGRGQEKVAPALVGSELVLGAEEIPTRILLHGKEGPTGLMPPIGSAFSDEQVAGVLTYVRRAWGHRARPVTPDAVAAVRRATADRTRPWTDAELAEVGAKMQ